MRQNDKPTKQRIREVSIELFARHGFNEVSMRQIAGEVGIKASSLYKHYAGKEDILESIFELFRQSLAQAQADGELPPATSAERYLAYGYEQFKRVMWTPVVLDIAKIITREQQRSRAARAFFLRELIEKPTQAMQLAFDVMKRQGFLRDMDTRVLAEEYVAYIVSLYFEQNLLCDSPDIGVIDERMKRHNDFFARCVFKQGE